MCCHVLYRRKRLEREKYRSSRRVEASRGQCHSINSIAFPNVPTHEAGFSLHGPIWQLEAWVLSLISSPLSQNPNITSSSANARLPGPASIRSLTKVPVS
ncbi:hypothetical protein CLAIMM_06478 isoform 2 [Cladophialophora immunda]|nr:hypothetical protein CLAIMM_06478 isoform 2 [Cladophialophora immunda]